MKLGEMNHINYPRDLNQMGDAAQRESEGCALAAFRDEYAMTGLGPIGASNAIDALLSEVKCNPKCSP